MCSRTHGGLVPLKELTKLEALNIGWCNCIMNPDIKSLSGLTNLKKLQISQSTVADSGIVSLKGLKKLSLLDMDGCPVTVACMDTISGLVALTYLNIKS